MHFLDRYKPSAEARTDLIDRMITRRLIAAGVAGVLILGITISEKVVDLLIDQPAPTADITPHVDQPLPQVFPELDLSPTDPPTNIPPEFPGASVPEQQLSVDTAP